MAKAEVARKRNTPQNVTPEQINDTKYNLAKNIKMFRELAGLTQDDVARALGCSSQAVPRWEQGIAIPGPDWLTALADLLGVQVGNLFGATVEPPKKRRRK